MNQVETKWACVSESAYEVAAKLVRGCYQQALLNGNESLSGSTLRGKAARYGAHYARSRAAFLARCRRAGLEVVILRQAHGRLVLVLDRVDSPALAA